ncbi:uncharacterized protein LOC143531811 [Bidens hawaiensis]|uniref:uncharacterized protein LOC143531811 n=1 Tax=Bidens hawaiensis TaxID=980011 RepID=UPI00404A9656
MSHSPEVQNQETLIDETSNGQKEYSSLLSQTQSSSPDFIQKIGKDEVDDIEDDESDFKMGRLIRQASLNSSHMSTPQQTTKIMRGSSCLPRYLTEKAETNREKVMNTRKVEIMSKRNRNKSSMKIGKNINDGAPTIPGGLADKGSSEDMKAQIKFWARTVAFNLHQEC